MSVAARQDPSSLCHLFGIGVPIIGAPMGGVSGPELAAAVSEAGGLGFLGHANLDPDLVREEIRETRRLTRRPFGIGLLFPSGAAAEAEPAPPLPDFLQRFAAETVPAPTDSYSHDLAERRLTIAIEEGVAVLALGLGAPKSVVDRAHYAGMKVISLVGSLRAALEVQTLGVDAVVAQGHEAGGHTGRTSTLVLVPQIADALDVPVVAAGGIVDARGMAAALVLGASGALVGTRLLATPEARTAEVHKRKIVEMQADETIVSRCYTGKPSRVIRNAFVDAWRGHEDEILPMPRQWERVARVVIPAKRSQSLDVANWPTGQGAVLIRRVQPAGEIIREMAEGAARLLNKAENRETTP